MNTVTPQMMYSNMSDTNERVKRLEHIMNEGLSKLDLLETMVKNLDTFELNISQIRIEIDDIKETQDKHIRIIDKQETHHHNVEGRLRNLENSNRQLEGQNIELREKFLTLQTHSMKYNLIFDGIKNNQGEKTEDVIRNFLSKELEITNIENIQFQNVHRVGER
jgi:septal ring factor EnvC (AmiA/AmiB activator)